MKNFFIAVLILFSFQFSYADLIESCRLAQTEIQIEDGRNGGIEVGMVLENGQAVSVSDDILVKEHTADDLNQIISETRLKSVVESLHLTLENLAAVKTVKVASDALVISLIDENGRVLVKLGQTQKNQGVCEPETTVSSQTPSLNLTEF